MVFDLKVVFLKMGTQEEYWKDISGYENLYQASSFGRFRNVKTGRILATSKATTRYITLSLSKGGKVSSFKAHRLIAILFIENPQNKRTINHKNGIKNDNRAINLEWATYTENAKHSFANGRVRTKRPISEREIVKINGLLRRGLSPYEISKRLAIGHVSIYEIKNGKKYNRNLTAQNGPLS